MASTVLTPTKPEKAGKPGGSGGGLGGFGRGGSGRGGGWHEFRVSARTYRLGMWFALSGIVMLFAAFTSALVVRKGMSLDWVSVALPRILWLNTGVLLASSVTLELSRRALRGGFATRFVGWLYATLALGLAFLGGQLVAWRELASRESIWPPIPAVRSFTCLRPRTASTFWEALSHWLMSYIAPEALPAALPEGLRWRSRQSTGTLWTHFGFISYSCS